MLTLVYAPNTCAIAPQIALEEAGASYELRKISLAAGDQRKPDYLAINPKGRVPSVIAERGVLTECPAILVYIAQTNPKAKLAPLDDPFAFAQVQAFNVYICATLHTNFAHKTRGVRWADDGAALAELARKTPQTVRETFELIENTMIRGPYVTGADYTIADMYLFTLARWMGGVGLTPSQFPKIDAMMKLLNERPAVKKVLAVHAAG